MYASRTIARLAQINDKMDSCSTIFLLANKMDEADGRTISREELRSLARRLSVNCYEVSAKTGENIEEAFIGIAREVLNKVRSADQQDSSKKIMDRLKVERMRFKRELQHGKDANLSKKCW